MIKRLSGYTLLALCWTGSASAATNINTLEKFVQQRNYNMAWQQAQQLATNNEGDPRFDYLYGLSALETGNYDHAVFALERAVVSQPLVIRPRLELARAYLKINNPRAALREFRQVLELNPPPTVQQNVNRVMTTISRRDDSISKHELNSRLSAAVGYDSNANFGADSATLETPVFGTVTLNAVSVKQTSPFTRLQGQFNYRYVVSNRLSWFGNVNLEHKHYKDAADFNPARVDASGGALLTTGQQQYMLLAKQHNLWLDDSKYKQEHGLQIGAAHDLNNATVLSGALALNRYDYAQQPLRDGRGLAGTLAYSFGTDNTRHRIQGRLGREKAEQKAGQHHARTISGLNYRLSHTWSNNHSSSVSLDYLYLRHQGNDPVYSGKRSDRRFGLQIGHAIKLNKHTSFFISAGSVDNASNLPLYTTDKKYLQTGLSYQF